MLDKSATDFVADFAVLMAEIGAYGRSKHGDMSTQARIERGDLSRWERITPEANALHAADHFQMYRDGIVHDHFGTLKHQLAAVAFNALMEYHLAKLAEVEKDK
jgi:hypothetical protein